MLKKLLGLFGAPPPPAAVASSIAPQDLKKNEPREEQQASQSKGKGTEMSDEMITPENVSVEMLKAVFEAAFMDASIDSDGDLLVKDACRVFVRPDVQRKNRVRLFTLFRFTEGSTKSERLECINRINSEYIMVTACAMDNGALYFRYDMSLEGGITKKALVLALKRFASIPHGAVQEHGRSIVQ